MNDAILVWDALKSKISSLVKTLTGNCLRCERYDVTTAPNGSVIGVTRPFGNTELFIPYSQEVANAVAGDTVLVAWHNTMSNAKAISYGDGFRGSPSNISNPNLLDNWYFIRPVNQRGQSSYTGNGYGFDRWSTNFSGDTTSLTSDGIKSLTASTIVGWHLHQMNHEADQLAGKSITLSADVSAMKGTATRWRCSFRDSTSSSTSESHEISGSFSLEAGIGIVSATGIVPEGTKSIWVGLFTSSGAASGDYVTTRRVKLEIGTASTLEDDVPDTTAELLKCQRYFVRYGGEISLYGYSSANGTTAYTQMIFPVSPASPMDCSLLSEGITVISDTGRTTGNVFSMGTTTRGNRQPLTITGLSLTPYRPILAKFDAAVEFSCEP